MHENVWHVLLGYKLKMDVNWVKKSLLHKTEALIRFVKPAICNTRRLLLPDHQYSTIEIFEAFTTPSNISNISFLRLSNAKLKFL